jgi:hypothetical protein
MPASILHPEPSVQRRWKKLAGEPIGDGGEPYTGYDRFGRTEQMRWYKVDGESDDPLVRVQWGYNRASLKTWRRDLLAPSATGHDQRFGHDGLYQLTARLRGGLNISTTAVGGTPAQVKEFGNDETGHWVTCKQGNDGALDIDRTCQNKGSNQVTQIEGASTGVSNDPNGSMTRVSMLEEVLAGSYSVVRCVEPAPDQRGTGDDELL